MELFVTFCFKPLWVGHWHRQSNALQENRGWDDSQTEITPTHPTTWVRTDNANAKLKPVTNQQKKWPTKANPHRYSQRQAGAGGGESGWKATALGPLEGAVKLNCCDVNEHTKATESPTCFQRVNKECEVKWVLLHEGERGKVTDL